jgi:hypothetical protein
MLPIPSNAHWMPLASIVQVPFLSIFGNVAWAAALPFALIGAVASPLAWGFARDAGSTRTVAVGAGILTAVPLLSTVYLVQPDNFSLFQPLVLGSLWLGARALRGSTRAFLGAGLLAGLATLSVALVALWLIVLGAGILMLGLPPREVEVARGVGFLVVAIAYGGVWLAVSLLFSVIFRSTATSALCALGLWLFFFILWPQLASAIFTALGPSEIRNLDEYVAAQSFGLALMRLSPGTLFTEAVLGLLNPETRTLGPMLPFQMRGAILGAPLPFDQSLLLIWPQITGLIAGMIVVFAAAYVIFQREEVRA